MEFSINYYKLLIVVRIMDGYQLGESEMQEEI